VIHDRVRRVLEEKSPAFPEPDTSMWPIDHDYGAKDSHAVFHDLAALRESLINRLREINAAGWGRTGIFEGRGELSLRDYLREVVSHDGRYVQEARDAVA
jgi:hypothetical protein